MSEQSGQNEIGSKTTLTDMDRPEYHGDAEYSVRSFVTNDPISDPAGNSSIKVGIALLIPKCHYIFYTF